MEILVALLVAYVVYRLFKTGNTYRKSEAATVVQKLLEPVHQFGMFEGNPAEAAREYVEAVWKDSPHIVEDASGNRPDAVPVAAYALALAAKNLFGRKDNNAYAVSIALGKALTGIQSYGASLREGKLNAHFINSAEHIYLTVVRPTAAEESPAVQQLTESPAVVDEEREALIGEAMLRTLEGGYPPDKAALVGKAIGKVYDMKKAKSLSASSEGEAAPSAALRKVESNPAEGVFQMPEFPYATYEAWLDAYRRSASEATEALKIQTGDNGHKWSLIDLMDDAPLRSAFAHHLDPVPLGTYFGKTFDITKMR